MKGCRRVKPWRVWGWVALAARGWLGPWVALAGLINEGIEAGETLTLLGWLGPWVALAGLINEGMEEGETLAASGAGSLWPQGAGWGRGSLWPDLLMKGWRRVKPWRVWAGSLWPQGAGWGRGSLWPDLLMKGWRRVSLGASGLGRFGRKGLTGAVRRFGRTY